MEIKKTYKRAPNTPAIREAEKSQRIAAEAGFDWNDHAEIIHKIIEEVDECIDAIQAPNSPDNIAMELGDIIFSCINLARFLNIDPEQALELSTTKFKKRMNAMKHKLDESNSTFTESSQEELDRLWQAVKKAESA